MPAVVLPYASVDLRAMSREGGGEYVGEEKGRGTDKSSLAFKRTTAGFRWYFLG